MTTETDPRPHVGQLSVDSIMLSKRLATAQFGDVINYSELSKLIGRDVQNDARGCLVTAMKIVRRDNQIVFGTVRNVGIRRLNDDEIVDTPKAAFRRIRNISTKAGRVLACADTSKLPPEKQRAASAALSVAGAIALFSSAKSLLKLEAVAKPAAIPAKIDVSELAELFTKKGAA